MSSENDQRGIDYQGRLRGRNNIWLQNPRTSLRENLSNGVKVIRKVFSRLSEIGLCLSSHFMRHPPSYQNGKRDAVARQLM